MDFTFVKNGAVAFFRSDAEQADWTQEELNLVCTFPYMPDKTIERGMVVLFQDPATSSWQAYEIRQCTLMPGEYYQQFTAEDIAVSELTDCHVQNRIELDNVSASNALSRILSGTGWSVGTTAGGNSSGDIERGSVWQNVTTIAANWNVYIMPRVTVNADGISGRYLDILPYEGVDRGLRLAINKNVTDPCVTYDDTDMYTALYGYGGTYTEGSLDDRVTLEYNFSSVVWSKTVDHPAKPAGQRYLEWPEMTALYGRNGRPRFGYYQNVDINNPTILLQKTWEALKVCAQPKISITGTVTDLKRIGYADQPLRLHDMAIVELEPVGLLLYKQIVRLTVDLLDPTKNLPEIGDYIPNIIYINRDTENVATGGGKGVSGGRGGGGGRGKTKVDLEWSEYKTNLIDNGRQIILNAQHIDRNDNILEQAGLEIDPVSGVLIYAEDNVNMIGSKFHVQSDRITSEVNDRKSADTQLSSRITQTANSISLEVSERKAADTQLSGRITVEANRITQEVTRATTAEGTLSGRITTTAEAITAEVTRATSAEGTLDGKISVEAGKITQIVSAVGSNGQVTAASICLAINNGGSSATINADKIYLLGETIANTITADYISGKIATLNVLRVAALTSTGNIACSNGYIMAPYFYLGSAGNATNLANAIMSLKVVQDGNNYKIQKMDFDDGDWVDVPGTFSRATSLTGGWSSGIFTVNASPQGDSFWTNLVQGTVSWSGNTATVPVEAIDSDNQQYQYATGRSITVDATARYNAGDTAGYNRGFNVGGATAFVSGSNNITSNGSYTYKGMYTNSDGDDVESGNNLSVTVDVPQGITGLTAWNNGSSASLYYYDTSSLTYKVATGSGKRWYYKS